METKLFEVLDNATCMVVMATRMTSSDMREEWLLKRVGFHESHPCILLNIVGDGRSNWDLYNWPTGTSRTITIAHHYIIENFETLPNGAVIDILYVMGDIGEPRQSEQIEELFAGKELTDEFKLDGTSPSSVLASEIAKKIEDTMRKRHE